MYTFFKAVLIIGCMFLIVPLAIWAATGKLSHAWFALKQYLLVMAIIVIPGLVISAISIGLSYLN